MSYPVFPVHQRLLNSDKIKYCIPGVWWYFRLTEVVKQLGKSIGHIPLREPFFHLRWSQTRWSHANLVSIQGHMLSLWIWYSRCLDRILFWGSCKYPLGIWHLPRPCPGVLAGLLMPLAFSVSKKFPEEQ